jgi:signal transduction histidine kinase
MMTAMAYRDQKPMTAWTLAGIGAVSITFVMAGLGMVLAIRQTQSLADRPIADLRPEARRIIEGINERTLPRIKEFLEGVGKNLRADHRDYPFTGIDTPLWLDEVYLIDDSPSMVIWVRRDDGAWNRWRGDTGQPEKNEQYKAAIRRRLYSYLLAAQFDLPGQSSGIVPEMVEGEPVLYHWVDEHGVNGETVVAARLDQEEFVKQVVEPALPEARLEIVPRLAAKSKARLFPAWTEQLTEVAPPVAIAPAAEFVDLQHRNVTHQMLLFVVATAMAMAALLGVLWAMWRVFRREIALSKMKQAFVADVSHELKTPLALIRLFGETLMSGRVPTEAKRQEYYEIITRESGRLTHLINNILDFSRIDAGRKRYSMQATDISELVRETYEAYQLQLDHEGFEHQLIMAEALPTVYCDRDAVAQALINLINNAMKYTEKNDRFLGIDVSGETRRGRHGVLISVSDRGIGISPEDRNYLFQDFYRSNDERVRQRRGAGLGLALVKHIVDAHGGIVDVESRLVKGSTFRIFLPIGSESNAEDGSERPGLVAEVTRRGTRRSRQGAGK